MSKGRVRNDERSRIAHLAARIMVEDGVESYATAKRKAARQAGARDMRQLPTNEEIEAALRVHQSLFAGDTHRERLRELRVRALAVMHEMRAFNPYLTGSVLSGCAGKYADINLQLYTDNAKSVELYLIDRKLNYRAGQSRVYVADELKTVPTFTLDKEGVDVELVVLTTDDVRHHVRFTAEGKPAERAPPHAVQLLLEST